MRDQILRERVAMLELENESLRLELAIERAAVELLRQEVDATTPTKRARAKLRRCGIIP